MKFYMVATILLNWYQIRVFQR